MDKDQQNNELNDKGNNESWDDIQVDDSEFPNFNSN